MTLIALYVLLGKTAKPFSCQTYQPISNHHQLENKLRKNFLAFRKSLVFLLLIGILTSPLQSTWSPIFTAGRNEPWGGDKQKLTFSLTNHLPSFLFVNSWAGLYKPKDKTVFKRPIIYWALLHRSAYVLELFWNCLTFNHYWNSIAGTKSVLLCLFYCKNNLFILINLRVLKRSHILLAVKPERSSFLFPVTLVISMKAIRTTAWETLLAYF